MAILKADSTTTLNGVKVNEYLLTKHNTRGIDMPTVSMSGNVIGVTVHNTDWIATTGTTPAEQYTRATVNGNMNTVRVHYYVDSECAWQNLPLTLSGWHAADGSGNGNRKTIAIECIMSNKYNDTDKKSEDNCARLAAYLLHKYGFGIDRLYTHTHWLAVQAGRKGTVDTLNQVKGLKKWCPLYILPHWSMFKALVAKYLNELNKVPDVVTSEVKLETITTATSDKVEASKPITSVGQIYRVRKSWSDVKSQIGAYSSLANAKSACTYGYSVFDSFGTVMYTGQLTTGTKITVKAGSELYSGSSTTKPVKTFTKDTTYYIYDGVNMNGRYRITNSLSNCGKTPIGSYVTGYVKKDAIS